MFHPAIESYILWSSTCFFSESTGETLQNKSVSLLWRKKNRRLYSLILIAIRVQQHWLLTRPPPCRTNFDYRISPAVHILYRQYKQHLFYKMACSHKVLRRRKNRPWETNDIEKKYFRRPPLGRRFFGTSLETVECARADVVQYIIQ